jgi:hypothetical protein
MTSQSTRCETALAYLASFEHLDTKILAGLRTSICKHIFAPVSYQDPIPLSNEEFAAQLSKIKGVIVKFAVKVKEVMEDPVQNRVMIWADGEPTWANECMDDGLSEEEWAYRAEYMFVLSMDESEEKIERIVEFLDT